MEFLHADWLKQVLSWQKSSGCFGRMPVSDLGRSYRELHNLDYEYENQQKETKDKYHESDFQREDLSYKKGIENNVNTKIPLEKFAQNVESAVIQQSNKLHLVEANSNKSFITNHQVKPPVKFYPSMSDKKLKKYFGANKRQKLKRSLSDSKITQNKFKSEVLNKYKRDKKEFVFQQIKPPFKVLDPNNEFVHQPKKFSSKSIGSEKEGKYKTSGAHVAAIRRLLFEKSLKDNCLSHKTAVAAGALSQYLRFLVNPGSPNYQSQVTIEGENLILNLARQQQENGQHKENNRLQQGKAARKKLVNKISKGNNPSYKKGRLSVEGKREPPRIKESQKLFIDEHHVVPRPHPDDVIHSEAMENIGDEDNHPQDYYNADGDANNNNDDLENYENNIHQDELPKLTLKVNPKFRHDLQINNLRRGNNQGDEEYEQYVDDEEVEQQNLINNQYLHPPKVQKLDLLNPRRPGDTHVPRRVVIDVPAGETAREAKHDEDTYSYYDENDETDNELLIHRRDGRRGKLAAGIPRAKLHFKRSGNELPDRHSVLKAAAAVSPGPASAPGRIYMILFLIMLVVLAFMYRFVKKRRIVIRYHRNGFR